MADLVFVPEPLLVEKVLAALLAAGADSASAQASTRAMLHASRFGIDSHGVRLTSHYAAMMQSGRINPRPNMTLKKTAAGTARLDADNALGHGAAYRGMEAECELAREAGVGSDRATFPRTSGAQSRPRRSCSSRCASGGTGADPRGSGSSRPRATWRPRRGRRRCSGWPTAGRFPAHGSGAR
jgi:hypothetical protein